MHTKLNLLAITVFALCTVSQIPAAFAQHGGADSGGGDALEIEHVKPETVVKVLQSPLLKSKLRVLAYEQEQKYLNFQRRTARGLLCDRLGNKNDAQLSRLFDNTGGKKNLIEVLETTAIEVRMSESCYALGANGKRVEKDGSVEFTKIQGAICISAKHLSQHRFERDAYEDVPALVFHEFVHLAGGTSADDEALAHRLQTQVDLNGLFNPSYTIGDKFTPAEHTHSNGEIVLDAERELRYLEKLMGSPLQGTMRSYALSFKLKFMQNAEELLPLLRSGDRDDLEAETLKLRLVLTDFPETHPVDSELTQFLAGRDERLMSETMNQNKCSINESKITIRQPHQLEDYMGVMREAVELLKRADSKIQQQQTDFKVVVVN